MIMIKHACCVVKNVAVYLAYTDQSLKRMTQGMFGGDEQCNNKRQRAPAKLKRKVRTNFFKAIAYVKPNRVPQLPSPCTAQTDQTLDILSLQKSILSTFARRDPALPAYEHDYMKNTLTPCQECSKMSKKITTDVSLPSKKRCIVPAKSKNEISTCPFPHYPPSNLHKTFQRMAALSPEGRFGL